MRFDTTHEEQNTMPDRFRMVPRLGYGEKPFFHMFKETKQIVTLEYFVFDFVFVFFMYFVCVGFSYGFCFAVGFSFGVLACFFCLVCIYYDIDYIFSFRKLLYFTFDIYIIIIICINCFSNLFLERLGARFWHSLLPRVVLKQCATTNVWLPE